MTIKEFIEKAIGGGYDGYPKPFCIECGNYEAKNGGDLFLDPKSWEAVGKVEGYENYCAAFNCEQPCVHVPQGGWINKMHQMIDHLIEGGTVESYLETL